VSFGVPLGLLGLLAVPALLGLYFLRRRQPPRVVSALFLWTSPDQRAEAGPRLERFSREVTLALELAAALAATAYLADIRFGVASADTHTVIVLDSSFSMAARLPGGKTVAELAVAQARRIAEADGGRVTVVESGLRPRIAEGPASIPGRLSSLRFSPSAPAHDLAPALALARELAGPRCRIRLITDRPIDPAPEGVEVVAVGEPLDNDAFVAAARADRDGKAIVALRVAHFSGKAAQIPIELVTAEGKVIHSESASFSPGEEKALRVEVGYGGALVARLPQDALPLDGTVRLLPQPPRPLKVAIKLPDGPGAESLRRFLLADGSASVADPPDLTFAAPETPGSAPWTVLLGAGGEAKTVAGSLFADRRHPLLDSVPLEGLLWSAGPPVPGLPLVTSGEAILVSEEAGPVFRINADLARSNLQRTAAWPVLLSNLFAMRREAMPGFPRRNVALDEEIVANLEGQGRWTLKGPTSDLPLRGLGTLRLAAPGVPGHYRLLRDGELIDELEVMPIDRRESDLRERASGKVASSWPVGRVFAERPRSAIPLLLLALMLCLDWMVTARAAGTRAKSQAVPR
jgi:hypothetical protein